ncbi:hypothetical protein [Pannonibacter phragmitetus]|uniref:hypothetical protein n=1 Tax=Pannonibacter phragmitetus TaxID=121719 RepID=UPI000B96258D|nr:hypothetical protein [Pannonibacter phragmitetus]
MDAMVEPWHDEDGGADVLFSGLVLIPHAAAFGFLEQVMVPGKSACLSRSLSISVMPWLDHGIHPVTCRIWKV